MLMTIFGVFFVLVSLLLVIGTVANSLMSGGARLLNLIVHGGMVAWIIIAMHLMK